MIHFLKTNPDPTNPLIIHWLEEVKSFINQGSLLCSEEAEKSVRKSLNRCDQSGLRVSYVCVTYTLCVTSALTLHVVYYTVMKHDGHLIMRTRRKCRKHLPAARVFYLSRVFSNIWIALSQCNTWLRLLYLLYDIFYDMR